MEQQNDSCFDMYEKRRQNIERPYGKPRSKIVSSKLKKKVKIISIDRKFIEYNDEDYCSISQLQVGNRENSVENRIRRWSRRTESVSRSINNKENSSYSNIHARRQQLIYRQQRERPRTKCRTPSLIVKKQEENNQSSEVGKSAIQRIMEVHRRYNKFCQEKSVSPVPSNCQQLIYIIGLILELSDKIYGMLENFGIKCWLSCWGYVN